MAMNGQILKGLRPGVGFGPVARVRCEIRNSDEAWIRRPGVVICMSSAVNITYNRVIARSRWVFGFRSTIESRGMTLGVVFRTVKLLLHAPYQRRHPIP